MVSLASNLRSFAQYPEVQQVAGCIALSSVCAYGGTFIFTTLNPVGSAAYFASVSLIGGVVYQALEKLKASLGGTREVDLTIRAIQLLQIPLCFYFLHGAPGAYLTGKIKLEIIRATVVFVAIPVFFHFAIEACKDPTVANIAYAMGVLFPIANGLEYYM